MKQTSCLTPLSPCLTGSENWLSKEVCNGGHCQPSALCAPNPEANKCRDGVFLKERKKRYPSRDKVLDSPGGSLLLLPAFMLPTTWLIDQSIKWRSQDRRWSWNQVGYSCWKNGVPPVHKQSLGCYLVDDSHTLISQSGNSFPIFLPNIFFHHI